MLPSPLSFSSLILFSDFAFSFPSSPSLLPDEAGMLFCLTRGASWELCAACMVRQALLRQRIRQR